VPLWERAKRARKTKDTVRESTEEVCFADDPERSTGVLNPHDNGIIR